MFRLLGALIVAVAVPAGAVEPPAVPAPPAAASTDSPAPVAPPAVVAPGLTPAQIKANEVVCRSEQETGSLVKKRKTCLTRKQWAYVNDQHQREARKMVEDNSGRPTGN